MKVLNCYPAPDVLHGTELAMHGEAVELKRRGHCVFLAHGMPTVPRQASPYDETVSLPPLFDGRKWIPAGLKVAESDIQEFVRTRGVDVVHVHGGVRAGVLRRLTGRFPMVVSVHVPLCPNGSRYLWNRRCVCDRRIGMGCLTSGYVREGCGRLGNGEPWGLPGFARSMWEVRSTMKALRKCSRVVANSEWMARRLEADGIPSAIVRVVCPPINHLPIVTPQAGELPESAPVVTFVGRLMDFKGPDHLLLASTRVKTAHRVWFIGAGALEGRLRRMSHELGLADRVTFFGSVAPERVNELRVRSSVIVVPSLLPEAFGMVGPEALAIGRPVVAYDVGGIREWLHPDCGILVKPGDVDGLAKGIGRLLSDPYLARTMGDTGPAHAARWSPARHAESLEDVYAQAVDHFRCNAASAILKLTV